MVGLICVPSLLVRVRGADADEGVVHVDDGVGVVGVDPLPGGTVVLLPDEELDLQWMPR